MSQLVPKPRFRLNQIRKIYPDTLFVIEITCYDQIVVFSADREKNNLRGVKTCWRSLSNLSQSSPLGPDVAEHVFNVTVTPTDSRAVYDMKIGCFPTRPIHLHLKKGTEVIAKALIKNKLCRLDYIIVNAYQLPPSISGMWAVGVHKDKETKKEQKLVDKIPHDVMFKKLMAHQGVQSLFG